LVQQKILFDKQIMMTYLIGCVGFQHKWKKIKEGLGMCKRKHVHIVCIVSCSNQLKKQPYIVECWKGSFDQIRVLVVKNPMTFESKSPSFNNSS
jgi:hypothetical protein